MDAQQIINQCTVEGFLIKLPTIQLDRELYEQVKKSLVGIGGKWKGGKVSGFEFKYDPSGLLDQLQQGQEINLKQEFQFFATPDSLADRLVELADVRSGLDILEPSAGQGSLVCAIRREVEFAMVDCFESMPSNRFVLSKVAGVNLIGEDFSLVKPQPRYDRVIANPPFTKGQDIEHIQLMYEWLNAEGRLVAIASTSWQIGSTKKQVSFRDWLQSVGAQINQIDAGVFKESGTSVPTCIIYIDRTGKQHPELTPYIAEATSSRPKKDLYVPEKLEEPEYYLRQIQASLKEQLKGVERLFAMLEKSDKPQPAQLDLFS